jgi:alkylhydroperoxidase family enzyme
MAVPISAASAATAEDAAGATSAGAASAAPADGAAPSHADARIAAPYDVEAREAYITGKPPRIGPLPADAVAAEGQALMAALHKASGSPAPLKAEVPEFIATFLRHPRLARAHLALADELFRSELASRDRELAILRASWLSKAPFEWGEHVKIGKRIGLSDLEIERVTLGSSAPGWNEHDRAILRAVEELIETAMISDDTWAVLRRDLNDKQLIELPILIGQYQGVAYLQNTLRVRLMPGNPGLRAR